jgi:hypothetical protein
LPTEAFTGERGIRGQGEGRHVSQGAKALAGGERREAMRVAAEREDGGIEVPKKNCDAI